MIEKEIYYKYLKIIKLNQKRTNIQQLQQSLDLVLAIQEAHPTVKSLLNLSDYFSASNLIIKAQQTLHLKLRNLNSVKNNEEILRETKIMVEKLLNEEFERLVIDEIGNTPFKDCEKLIKSISDNELQDTKESVNFETFEKLTNLLEFKVNSANFDQNLEEIYGKMHKSIKANINLLLSKAGIIRKESSCL